MNAEQIDEWLLADFDPGSLRVLEDREEEPDFSAIIKGARERIAGVDFDDPHVPLELEAIRGLLSIILHLDNTLDAYYYDMSDRGELPEGA